MSRNKALLKTEIKSPDYLGHKPNSNEGVIRIGRKPLICVGLGLSVIAGVMTYTLVDEIYCCPASQRRRQ